MRCEVKWRSWGISEGFFAPLPPPQNSTSTLIFDAFDVLMKTSGRIDGTLRRKFLVTRLSRGIFKLREGRNLSRQTSVRREKVCTRDQIIRESKKLDFTINLAESISCWVLLVDEQRRCLWGSAILFSGFSVDQDYWLHSEHQSYIKHRSSRAERAEF